MNDFEPSRTNLNRECSGITFSFAERSKMLVLGNFRYHWYWEVGLFENLNYLAFLLKFIFYDLKNSQIQVYFISGEGVNIEAKIELNSHFFQTNIFHLIYLL